MCSFFQQPQHLVQIFLVQLLVVMRLGISECMGCMLACGHLGEVDRMYACLVDVDVGFEIKALSVRTKFLGVRPE